MTDQLAVTTVAPLKPGAERSLRELLERIGLNTAGNHALPLGRLSTTQFARLVPLDTTGDPHGQTIEPQLTYVSGTNAGEREVEQLRDLPDGIDQVFEHCERHESEQLIEQGR